MNDRDFDELVDEMKRSHHTPPPAPAGRMWARIAAARSEPAARPVRRARPGWTWWQAGLAVAAVLVLGIAIGRYAGRPGGMTVAEGPAPGTGPGTEQPITDSPPIEPVVKPVVKPVVRFAAANLYGRADALLTNLETADCSTDAMAPLPAWAGNMLAQTRLLLDTDLSRDPGTKSLLQDLELVLARIASLRPGDCGADVNRIREDIRTKGTVDRLRLAGTGGVDPRSL